MKKKIIISITVLVAISIAVLGYFIGDSPIRQLRGSLENRLSAYETDVEDSIAALNDEDKVVKFLEHWADSKSIDYNKDGNNVIMHRPASSGYEDVLPTVLVCNYDVLNMESSVKPFAIAFSALKVDQDMGELTVIFTYDKGYELIGAKDIDESYFPDGSKVVSLSQGSKHLISLNSGQTNTYTFTKDVSYKEISGDKAYRITISGVKGGIPDSKISSYPNPVNILGSLLAKYHGSSLLFDIASLEGGNSSSTYPTYASALIVISSDDEDRFLAKMESATESFYDDYSEDYPEAKLEFVEEALPEKVLSSEDANLLYSLLYTLFNGVYFKDEETDRAVSIASINYFKLDDDKITIKTSASSTNLSNLKEISTSLATLAGLSEFNYSKEKNIDIWQSEENPPIMEEFARAYKAFNGDNIEYIDSVPSTASSALAGKNKNAKYISITTNEDYILDDAGAIVMLTRLK